MDWVYLSPHLDDVALSCGGLVWQQARSRAEREAQWDTRIPSGVAIWTICAGDPPDDSPSPFAESLHTRWATGPGPVAARRAEDVFSCQRLGASPRHFSIPDAIYRRSPAEGAPLYASEESLFGAVSPVEYELVAGLRWQLEAALPPQVELVCPLGIGGHVDHRLVRAAAEALNRRLWFYADYPYVVRSGNRQGAAAHGQARNESGISFVLGRGAEPTIFPISEPGMVAWVEAVAAHASQIGSFWPSLAEMESELRAYCQEVGGVQLWSMAPV